MTNDTSKRDEWLTGLIDSQLTDAEAESLQSLMEHDADVGETLQVLQSNRDSLKQLAATNAQRAKPLPVDFADRVLAQIASSERLSSVNNTEQPSYVRRKLPGNSLRRVTAALLAVAAAIGGIALLANRLLPKNSDSMEQIAGTNQSSEGSTDLGDRPADADSLPENPFGTVPPSVDALVDDQDAASSSEGRRYVSDAGYNVSLTLVLDIELTQPAFESGVLDAYIKQAGIQLKTPIESNSVIEDSLAKSRMLPAGNASAVDRTPAKMYFVHADLKKLAKLLETVYRDVNSVPTVRFDVAFDTGINGFMQSIAASSGDRFALNESTAAPLSFDAQESSHRSSDLLTIAPQGRPVASNQRGRGQPELVGGAQLSGQSTALLVVRMAIQE